MLNATTDQTLFYQHQQKVGLLTLVAYVCCAIYLTTYHCDLTTKSQGAKKRMKDPKNEVVGRATAVNSDDSTQAQGVVKAVQDNK